MRVDEALVRASTAGSYLRDLHVWALEQRGLTGTEPELAAPLRGIEEAWGDRPKVALRRLAAVLSDEELGGVVFRMSPLDLSPGAPNLWLQLIARAHEDPAHRCDPTAALHGALPVGWLQRGPDRSTSRSAPRPVGLQGGSGARAGRWRRPWRRARGEAPRDLPAALEQAAAGPPPRYGAEPLDGWQTRSGWIGQLLEGGGLPDHLDDATFSTLNPTLTLPDAELLLGGSWCDRVYALWRSWLLGEDDLLEYVLGRIEGGPRLLVDAASLVAELRAGRRDLGPLSDLDALRAAAVARAARRTQRPPRARVSAPVPTPTAAPLGMEAPSRAPVAAPPPADGPLEDPEPALAVAPPQPSNP